jgi:hypothetical protein
MEIVVNKKMRTYDIDWLRVVGMLMVLLFHDARCFSSGDWHAKNTELDDDMSVFAAILNQSIMPLLFVFSLLVPAAFQRPSLSQHVSRKSADSGVGPSASSCFSSPYS